MTAHIVRLSRILWSEIQPNIRYALANRQPLLWILSLLTGLSVGLATILFREGIGLVQWTWLRETSEQVAGAARQMPWPYVFFAPVVGGAIVGFLIHRFMPGDRPFGVADVIEAKIDKGRDIELRPGLWSAAITVISLGFGASAGREGPMVHLGATLSEAVTRRLKLAGVPGRILLGCGVAAAVSASFNAPIAGVLFAHEVVLGHYAMSAFVPVVIASVSSGIVSRLWFGEDVAFTIPEYAITSYLEIPAFALLGLLCALVAVTFQFSLVAADVVARRFVIPIWLRPIIGGAAVGAIGVFYPDILGVGYETTHQALTGSLSLSLMLTLIAVKTAATAITLASRFGGGIFSPSLYLGALTGGAFAAVATGLFPALSSADGLYAILGMGAVAGATLGAPISTTVIVFELTGGYGMSIALLFTVSIAAGLTYAVRGRSFFQWQLETRGLFIAEGPHKGLVRQVRVQDFMERLPDDQVERFDPAEGLPFLKPRNSLEEALRALDSTGEAVIPVVAQNDATRLVGRVTHLRALRTFNKALIDLSVEEHR